jgi:predicted metal-dependent hydrolase
MIEDDPRFLRGVELFDAGDFLEASDEFEELFFEAVRDEVDFLRFFLQISVGIHHVERGQHRAAVERLEEGIRVGRGIGPGRGVDLERLLREIESLVPLIEQRARGSKAPIAWPKIRASSSG